MNDIASKGHWQVVKAGIGNDLGLFERFWRVGLKNLEHEMFPPRRNREADAGAY